MSENILQEDKRMNKRIRRAKVVRTSAITFVCFVLGILIAMQYKNIREIKANEERSYNSLYEYQKELIKLQEEVDKLTQEKAELQKKVDLFEHGSYQQQIEHLEKELKNVKLFAGLTKVKGSGIEIIIELTDPSTLENIAAALLMLINELKASTAQAIAINGVRIGAMSEVRVVATSLVIDGQVYGQPIRIAAIGDQNNLLGILSTTRALVDHIGKFGAVTITPRDNLILDAYDFEKVERYTSKLTPVEE
ncbi:MAG TPA: DUF881 domain-containing protein [Clostridia bacterium]|nr:DUF881 domain-containing protein [Clostridia bacterium]